MAHQSWHKVGPLRAIVETPAQPRPWEKTVELALQMYRRSTPIDKIFWRLNDIPKEAVLEIIAAEVIRGWEKKKDKKTIPSSNSEADRDKQSSQLDSRNRLASLNAATRFRSKNPCIALEMASRDHRIAWDSPETVLGERPAESGVPYMMWNRAVDELQKRTMIELCDLNWLVWRCRKEYLGEYWPIEEWELERRAW